MAASGADGIFLSNASASSAALNLLGGEYGVLVTASWGGGSVTLQALAGDGSTFITVLPAFTSNGFATIDLPAGCYQLTVATATAIYASVVRIKRT